ncbi:hypothetical protein BC938DRAFT_478468 [Jimgerdemannia flammicorona]|uniref:RING-type domain-containing protein n=1 Tax=Jimgerdemannia flammicorona TaxID=994334 RepID=A0A433QMU0_9FUNG|nr:hypothetical protein BC938DRAFT_478468 [Jimgerdemannia flammicorona]
MPTPPQQQPQTAIVTSPSLHFSDFLHCNNCFLLYTLAPNADNTFYLIECSHVLCKACLKSGNRAPSDTGASGTANVPSDTCFTAFCPLCKDRYSFAELNDKLPQTIERFFKPAQELLDDAYETLQFQNRNLLGLVRYLNDKVAKQRKVLESAKEEIKKAVGYRKALHAVQEENKVLRAELTSGGDAGAEGAKRRRVPSSRSSESRSGGSEIRVASTSSSNSRIPLLQVSPNDQRHLHPPRTPNGPARLSLPAHGTSPAHDQARYQPYPPQPQQRYDGFADSGYAERGQRPVFNSGDVVG